MKSVQFQTKHLTIEYKPISLSVQVLMTSLMSCNKAVCFGGQYIDGFEEFKALKRHIRWMEPVKYCIMELVQPGTSINLILCAMSGLL